MLPVIMKKPFGLLSGSVTAAAGTAFSALIPPGGPSSYSLQTSADSKGAAGPLSSAGTGTALQGKSNRWKSLITTVVYVTSTTAHTLSFIREFSNTTLTATAAAAQKVANLVRDPGLFPLCPNAPATSRVATSITAANDFLVFECPDGTFYYDTVASVAAGTAAGNLSVTMTNNLPTGGINAGSRAWLMKAAGGTDVWSGVTNYAITTPISLTTTLADAASGVFSTWGGYSPIIIYSNNITAAGTLLWAAGEYVLLP